MTTRAEPRAPSTPDSAPEPGPRPPQPGPGARLPPDLLRRAGPVNRGAVGGRVQLDGRRLLLGHFGPGEGARNSEGRATPLASSLLAAPRPPRGAKSGPRARGLPSGDALCAVPSGPSGQWRSQETPAPLARLTGDRRASPPAQHRSPGIPSRSPSVHRSPGLEGPRRARTTALLQPQPGKVRRRHCRVPSDSAQ